MSSPFAPPFCFQWEQAEREKAFIILSWQHRTHATFLWVTSRSNGGGNGALNCLSFICLLLSLISTSCGAWREHEPLFQWEHVQVQRFYSTMVLHTVFINSRWSVFADRVQKRIKCPGRLDAWRLRAASRWHQKSILRSIYKTSW